MGRSRTLAALAMVAGLYCVLAAGCGTDGYAPDEHENLTPNEMQTFLREELGTTARIDQTHGDDTVTLLMTEHFDRWVYAKGWNRTGPVPDKIGDLVNPVPGARTFSAPGTPTTSTSLLTTGTTRSPSRSGEGLCCGIS